MVATAVAVARGVLPPAFIGAALTRPCRARTPMAPACTLVLADAAFWPFKPDTSAGGVQPGAEERKLCISDATYAAMDDWATRTLLPSLAPSLASAEWEEFLSNLEAMAPAAEDVDLIVQHAAAYTAEREARPPRERNSGAAPESD